MMKPTVLFLTAFLLPLSTSARQNGTYDFLRLDMNARAAGLNGSFVSMANDPNLVFYNPAGLPTLEKTAASASFLKHLLDVNAGSISFAETVEEVGTMGIGVSFIDYGSFDQTDESMNVLGTFGARELSLIGGWGMMLDEQTSVGGSLEFIYSSIGDFQSAALAIGAGILYQIPSEQITLGASVVHLGTQLNSYAGTKESLPLDITVGITKRPEHLPVYLNLNFHKLNESHDSFFDRLSAFSFGAEFIMSESFRLRGGYSNEAKRELKLGTSAGLAGFSFGLGLLFREYLIDYSFNSYGKIGGLHRFSVGTTF